MIRISAIALVFSLAAIPLAPAQQSPGSPAEPKLTVSSVRLENGFRASKIIGATVYNEQNEQVGTISDLFLSRQNQVAMAVVSVGSFLGLGGKLVSVPFDKIQIGEGNKIVMPGGSKDELKGMPNVEYNG
jgi:sporulation protein YlmC with PRC-barrel domain